MSRLLLTCVLKCFCSLFCVKTQAAYQFPCTGQKRYFESWTLRSLYITRHRSQIFSVYCHQLWACWEGPSHLNGQLGIPPVLNTGGFWQEPHKCLLFLIVFCSFSLFSNKCIHIYTLRRDQTTLGITKTFFFSFFAGICAIMPYVKLKGAVNGWHMISLMT